MWTMNEARRDRVSPHWQNMPYPHPASNWAIAQIHVLNPGPEMNRIRIRFFDSFGGLVWDDEPTIYPWNVLACGAPDWAAGQGLCHVAAEHPVVSWGLTTFLTANDMGYANMSFYTADPALREFHPERSTLSEV